MNAVFPILNKKEIKQVKSNSKDILTYLSVVLGERTLRKYENLENTRSFIKDYFRKYGGEIREEIYKVEGKEVANIVVEKKGTEEPEKIVLLGAHYDTVEGTPGADDNATSIAGLLEAFRLLSTESFKKTIRFVAFTLEEPPFYKTPKMGSMHHAKGCKKRKENIELMVCLEMLGYGDKKHKQDYPTEKMRRVAPNKGDFLTVVSLPSYTEYVFLWKKVYNEYAKKKIHDLIAPASIPGVDWSDHSSFISNGYSAIMVSDTGYYRNKNYHMPDDSIDRINFNFLSDNIVNISTTIRELLNMDID